MRSVNKMLGFLVGLLLAVTLSVTTVRAAAPTNFDYGVGDVFDRGDGTCGQVTSVDPWSVAFVLSMYPSLCYSQIWNGHYQARSPNSGDDACYQSIAWASTVSCDLLPPDEPDHCSNGSTDGDEMGIDCGGSCVAGCVWSCPVNYTDIDGACEYTGPFCIGDTDCPVQRADSFGNCPSGYDLEGTLCYYRPGKQLAADGITPAEPEVDGWQVNEVTETADTSINTVDNGNGTSTVTETTITTVVDGNGYPTGGTSTVTKTTIIDNTTGDIISTNIVNNTTVAPDETQENYDFDVPSDTDLSMPGGLLDTDMSGDVPEKSDLGLLIDTFVQNNPLTAVFAETRIETDNSVCSMQWDYKGTTVDFSLCGEPYYSTFVYMGNILVFICTITGYFIIFGRK